MNASPLRLGTAWYPELWPEQQWLVDLKLMRELGLDTVRVGEFAWSRFERTEGQYDTQWLAHAMDLAHQHHIAVILCTPTAAAPAWLMAKHPDIGYVNPDGYRHRHGGRQHADYCHPLFQQYSRHITQVLAQALGQHPALIAWQTDNELRGHQKISISPRAVAGWHRYLAAQYHSIEALNAAWVTDVWSQHYNSFDQVPVPYPLPNYAHNHCLLTQYRRYMNDGVLDFQRQQIDIIRAHSPAPITHNSEDSVDEHDLFADLDFAGVDCYTSHLAPHDINYRLDCFRALKPRRRFFIMETNCEAAVPGDLVPESWQSNFVFWAYAAGAAAVNYWHWRNNQSGSEIIGHASLLQSTGQKSTAWLPVQKAARLRDQLQPLLEQFSPAPAPAAFIRSERNGHFYYIDRVAGLEPNFNFRARLQSHYNTLQHLGLFRDVLFDQADLSNYRIIYSPYLPHTSTDFLQRISSHLDAGGVWVVGPYTGYLSQHHTNHTDFLLGPLQKLLDINVQHFLPMSRIPVHLECGPQTHALMHGHIFQPDPSRDQILGSYQSPRLRNRCWGLRRPVRNGVVYLLGSEIDDSARLALFQSMCSRENIPLFPQPQGVIAIPQVARDGRHALALINTTDQPQTAPLPSSGIDLLTNTPVISPLLMPPGSNAFIAFNA